MIPQERKDELLGLAQSQNDAHVDAHGKSSMYHIGYMAGLRAVASSLAKSKETGDQSPVTKDDS